MQVDIAIIGGGPAGSAAAITLAKSGRSVAVFDKAKFPRDKCCGDGLTTLALRLSETLGLIPSEVKNWKEVDEATLHWGDSRSVVCALPDDPGIYAAVVPRLDYDQALLNISLASGAYKYK